MLLSLFTLIVLVFSAWMFLDCMLHKTKNKIFWAVIIVTTFPIGPVLYASQRAKLIGETKQELNTPTGTIVYDSPNSVSGTSQLIRSIGMTLGVIMAVGGLLMVALIVFVRLGFSGVGGCS